MTAALRASLQSWRIACFRWEGVWLLTGLVVGLAAVWMTVHRDYGYNTVCARPSDLYQLSDDPWISHYSVEPGGRLTVEIENLDETRWIRIEDGLETETLEGPDPEIQLEPGITHTKLRGAKTGRVLDFRTQWVPGQSDPLVSHGGLRVGERSPFSLSDFVIPAAAQPIEHVEAARRLFAPRVFDESVPVSERVAILAAQLHADLMPHRGSPAPHMARLDGFEQYQEALAGRSEVYCANHAEIFAFMANAAGLPTRLIDVAGQVGDVALGAHSFVETYDAPESRWMYVDLQLGLAGVRDPSGPFLSALEVLNRILNRTTASLVTRTLADGRVIDAPWSDGADIFETFLAPESSLVFLTSSPDRFAPFERLERLIVSPRVAICRGGLSNKTSLRLAATWMAGLLGVVWVGWRTRHALGACACDDVSSLR